ncbi:hypothetical protein H7F37_03995 [Winogradskyella sp. PAMC22761]|nr:hypothetical protein H7F37_03995 [Winogradskyella sp. PAMC22761]
MKKIIEYLKIDKVQRIIYGIGLVLWIILWIDDLKFITNENFFGIYLWQVIIPALLLFAQLIFNNRILWIAIVGYLGLYSLWIIWNIVESDILIDIQRDYSPRPFWTFEKVQNWIIILTILSLINWLIWKIKPITKIKNVAQHRV